MLLLFLAYLICLAICMMLILSPRFWQLAKLAVFFETYYLITRQYGAQFSKSSFCFIAYKSSYLAKHVAIKSKVQHLANINIISYKRAEEYINKKCSLYDSFICDAAYW